MQKICAKNKFFFAKSKCKSENMGSSTVQISITWCRPDRYSNSKLIIKTYFYINRLHKSCHYYSEIYIKENIIILINALIVNVPHRRMEEQDIFAVLYNVAFVFPHRMNNRKRWESLHGSYGNYLGPSRS